MLKPSYQLKDMDDEDSDIYLQTKLQTYLKRPTSLYNLTYPEFYMWWRSATTAEQRKYSHEGDAHDIKCKGSNDFEEYVYAKRKLDEAQTKLSELLNQCEEVRNGHDLLALCVALKSLNLKQPIIKST